MSEDQDPVTKTEDPTPKRLGDAQRKGQVAKSQEVNHFFMIFAAGVVLVIFGHEFLTDVRFGVLKFLETPHQIDTDPGHLIIVLQDLLSKLIFSLGPIFGLLAIAAIAGNFVQNRPVFTGERMKPKLNKISPLKGLKRMFALRTLVDFAKSLLKLIIVAAVVAFLIWPDRNILPQLVNVETVEILMIVEREALIMIAAVVAVMGFVAFADMYYQKFEHIKSLRMTKQEIKDEQKQSEGDPMVKARIRQIRTERARKRMMAAVPEADVVVTNPTHYAVALEYKPDLMNAPKVVAKGIDSIARRIREIAEEHNVPIVENPPVARTLYAAVELDEEIPIEHYKAVAEIIGYIMQLKGKLRAGRRAAR